MYPKMKQMWPDSTCFPTLLSIEQDTGHKTVTETNKITEEVLLSHLRWVDINNKDGYHNEYLPSSNTCEDGSMESTSAMTFLRKQNQRLEIVQYILKNTETEVFINLLPKCLN